MEKSDQTWRERYDVARWLSTDYKQQLLSLEHLSTG